jgi:hypothetical protein
MYKCFLVKRKRFATSDNILRVDVLAHATSLTPPLFIEVPVAMQARKLSSNEFVGY